MLVSIKLIFSAETSSGIHGARRPFILDARQDVPDALGSPIFSRFPFASGGDTQYVDALLRTTFTGNESWHTLLAKPKVTFITLTVPAEDGYVLHSRAGGSIAVADADFLQSQMFQRIGAQPGKLVIAMTHNVTFYADGDATICCTWGTHGVDRITGNSFVLGSYLKDAPAIVEDRDVQPLTQQLAEFAKDPMHDPQHYGFNVSAPGNAVPPWQRPDKDGGCGGNGIATSYFLLEPTDTNLKNNFPASQGFAAPAHGRTYHLQNVALLPWYLGGLKDTGEVYSFPDAGTLRAQATPCAGPSHAATATVADLPQTAGASRNGHRLIGYWTGNGGAGVPFPLRHVSPQWDVVIVAFAVPTLDLPEGTLLFRVPRGIDPAELKADVKLLKNQGKKVMLSLGGGGQFFKLNSATSIPNFVNSVTSIVTEYGFDGVDIDFESPSLLLAQGDVDFRRPQTPGIMNLIAGLRQLHDHFGAGFMISLVPEGPQMPAAHSVYGGQFGSFLPLAYALRDILSFVDVQDYNTPPMEGLDGEIYQSHTVDYHAALTEMLLRGFNVGGDPRYFFPPLPANQVAVGFLTDYETPRVVAQAMRYLITGTPSAGDHYKLHRTAGYPGLIGAMFWTIDDDRLRDYPFSSVVGPQLHGYPTEQSVRSLGRCFGKLN